MGARVANNPCNRISNWIAEHTVASERVALVAQKVELCAARGLTVLSGFYVVYNLPTFLVGGALIAGALFAYDAVDQRARAN